MIASTVVNERVPWERPQFYLLGLALLTAILNYATSVSTVSLDMPFYLDSWATSLGTIVGGLWVGVAGGVLYNVLMALTHWGSSAMIWALSSVLVAICTWFFWNKGWINIHRPAELALAGMGIGTVNTVLVIALQSLGLESTLDTTTLRRDLAELFHDPTIAKLGEQLFVELMDKTVSLAMAAISLFAVGEWLRRGRADRHSP